MKKTILAVAFTLALTGFSASAQKKSEQIKVTIDLVNVKDDKVLVTVMAPKMTTDVTTFSIPKIIPGTYSEDDYGKFVEGFKAFDTKGRALTVTKLDDNSWQIKNAKTLSKITYYVNDTFDVENTHDVFSPAGTNIIDGKNYLLNMHGFVGYFDGKKTNPYQLTIPHPATIWGATSLVDNDASSTNDVFEASRYFELVDNPIMYSKPDYTKFTIDGMDILIAVYSATGKVDAKSITPDMEKMIRAQKTFLGDFNTTKKYSVLLYLSDISVADAKGFGALEHNTSTTVVLPEMMPKEQLVQALVDVVSHEFFHIVTPLSIHSKEIHEFDYNKPKMSEHLWMYEGITEYFANLFQVNQGLITEEQFYDRMAAKVQNASSYNDAMSFTMMSRNVLEEPFKSQYANVYEKGALIGMCLDIIIREESNGKNGILDLMKKLSTFYGPERPFNDDELFAKVIDLSYPEVGTFLTKYVEGETPIPYGEYFSKMGIGKSKVMKASPSVFLNGQVPYVTIKPGGKELMIIPDATLNPFMTELGLKGGDIIKSVNGVDYNVDNVYDLVIGSQEWKEGDAISATIIRDGKSIDLKGKVKLSYEEQEGWNVVDTSKDALREAWLKG